MDEQKTQDILNDGRLCGFGGCGERIFRCFYTLYWSSLEKLPFFLIFENICGFHKTMNNFHSNLRWKGRVIIFIGTCTKLLSQNVPKNYLPPPQLQQINYAKPENPATAKIQN